MFQLNENHNTMNCKQGKARAGEEGPVQLEWFRAYKKTYLTATMRP
jgi:hypothetical protein